MLLATKKRSKKCKQLTLQSTRRNQNTKWAAYFAMFQSQAFFGRILGTKYIFLNPLPLMLHHYPSKQTFLHK